MAEVEIISSTVAALRCWVSACGHILHCYMLQILTRFHLVNDFEINFTKSDLNQLISS